MIYLNKKYSIRELEDASKVFQNTMQDFENFMINAGFEINRIEKDVIQTKIDVSNLQIVTKDNIKEVLEGLILSEETNKIIQSTFEVFNEIIEENKKKVATDFKELLLQNKNLSDLVRNLQTTINHFEADLNFEKLPDTIKVDEGQLYGFRRNRWEPLNYDFLEKNQCYYSSKNSGLFIKIQPEEIYSDSSDSIDLGIDISGSYDSDSELPF
jgi:hypothetical protein